MADLEPGEIHLPDRQVLAPELSKLRSATGLPGLAIDIGVNGARLGLAMGRPIDGEDAILGARARFRINCAIKFFVALVASRLVAEGRLLLDAPVGGYLPELGTGPKASEIRVWHLLTHTTGYRGLDIGEISTWTRWSWESCVDYYRRAPQLFPPGAVFNEEHLDHVILGQVINRITGRRVMDLIQEYVNEPLNLTPGTVTGDRGSPELYVEGHFFSTANHKLEKTAVREETPELWTSALSEVTMTARDLGTLAQTLAMSDGPTLRKLGLDPVFLLNLLQPAVHVPAIRSARLNPHWVPSSFNILGARFTNGGYGYFGTGYGHNCAIVFDPQRKISLAVALNIEAAPLRTFVLDFLMSHILGQPAADLQDAIRPTPIDCDYSRFFAPFRPDELKGEYIGNTRQNITLQPEQRCVILTFGPQIKVVLKPDRHGRLVVETLWPVPIAIFADPATGGPCIMLGMHAYKRVP